MPAKRILGFMVLNVVALLFGMWAAASVLFPPKPKPTPEASALEPKGKAPAKAEKAKSKAKGIDALEPGRRAPAKAAPAPAPPSGERLPATRAGVAGLLKTHAVSISLCASRADLPSRVRTVDVTVHFEEAQGGLRIGGIVPRRPEDSRWGRFTDCLAGQLGRAAFKRTADASELRMNVRIP